MVAQAPRLSGTQTPTPVSPAWWVMTVLCWLVAAWSVTRYAALDPDRFFDEQKDVYLQHLPMLWAHAMGAVVALIIGPLQFHRGVREAWPRLHRFCGFSYIASILVAGCAALALAPLAFGGFGTKLAFGLLAVFWLGNTGAALYYIRRRDVTAHRRWAIRSFSLTFAAVTLRAWVGVLMVSGVGFVDAYAIAAWLCWVPNLMVAQGVMACPAKAGPTVNTSPSGQQTS